jgi:hypothetical protein
VGIGSFWNVLNFGQMFMWHIVLMPLVLVVLMAGVLSSPDVPSLSIKTWGTVDPVGFVNTAATELDGSSTSAGYGPPYNDGTGSVQQVGPVT